MTAIASGGRCWNEESELLGVLCTCFADRVLPSAGDVSVAKRFDGLGSNLVEFCCRGWLDRLRFLQIGLLAVRLHSGAE
jgi:hypothetical protein